MDKFWSIACYKFEILGWLSCLVGIHDWDYHPDETQDKYKWICNRCEKESK